MFELNQLTNKLSPSRSVKIQLSEPLRIEEFQGFGDIIDYEGQYIRLLIEKSSLSKILSKILSDFPVKDLEIKDPPIEELIGKLLEDGRIN